MSMSSHVAFQPKEVHAFEIGKKRIIAEPLAADKHRTAIGPGAVKVRGFVKRHASADIRDARGERHPPAVVFFPHIGIAPPETAVRQTLMGQHRIAFVLDPGDAAVEAARQTLDLRADSGVNDDRRSVVIHRRAAAIAAVLIRPAGRRRQRDRQVAPVNQIVADRMAPVRLRGPFRPVRPILEKNVILPTELQQPVGVAEKPSRREEMEQRPVGIGRHFPANRHGLLLVLLDSFGNWNRLGPRRLSLRGQSR